MVNNQGIIIHKLRHKKGRRHDCDIYKKDHPITPKEVVNIFDLGYLGVKKGLPEQLYMYCHTERREIKIYPIKKKNTTKIILKKE